MILPFVLGVTVLTLVWYIKPVGVVILSPLVSKTTAVVRALVQVPVPVTRTVEALLVAVTTAEEVLVKIGVAVTDEDVGAIT